MSSRFPFSRFHSPVFQQFLKSAFDSFTSSKLNPQKCVIGNEAADLDSNVCSIAYAFYLSTKGNDISNNIPVSVFPLHRVNSKEWHLRTEINFLHKKLALDMHQFLWWDLVEQYHRDDVIENDQMEWILVDHHNLGKGVKGRVMEVIDHHEVNPEDKERMNDQWNVETVGSCCTLIAERIAQQVEDRSVLLLLLATILIDTVNLDEEFKKVTPKDVEMASMLQEKLCISNEERQLLFEEVQKAKFDVSSLSLDDLLRSDYKEWTLGAKTEKGTNVGIASIRLPFSDSLRKVEDPVTVLENFRKERHVDLLLVMCAFEDENGEFRRELAFWSPAKNCAECEKMVEFLQSSILSLNNKREVSIATRESGKLFYFDQENVAASRKKLVPLLFQFDKHRA